MPQYPRIQGVSFRAPLLAAGLALLLAAPHGACAKDGDSGGRGSGHSGSDGSGNSDSGGHGSHNDNGSDNSGASSHSGKGSSGDDTSDDRGGSDDFGHSGKRTDSEERQHTYDGGWRAQIRNGRYQVFDPAGRVVINRKVKKSDYTKF